MYTLYWTPGSASQTPHGVLEEAGVAYELRRVDLAAGANQDPAYLKLNPNGKVPTLVVDNAYALFEGGAISMFIADRHPEAKLAPAPGDKTRGHYYQWMTHLTNSLQPAMLRYYYPDRHTSGDTEAVTNKALEEVAAVWSRIDAHLRVKGPYLLGGQFSAADIFAPMLSTWEGACPGIRERFPAVKRLADLVAARPAMQRVIKQNEAA
jgi:glutathione S-transferase